MTNDRQCNYIPNENMSFVATNKDGDYASELFSALYSKQDNSGYVNVKIYNVAQADYFGQSYIIE